MTELYGAIIGAKCAVLGFCSTSDASRSSSTVSGFYKKSGDQTFTEVVGSRGWTTGSSNFAFRGSAWESGLDVGTTYEVYVSVNGDESNHLTFTTLANIGGFDYTMEYGDYSSSGPVTGVTPSQSQEETAEQFEQVFMETMESIGITANDTRTFYLVVNPNSMAGADGITSGNLIYVNIRTGDIDRMLDVIVHEYRHLVFFNSSIMPGNYGYASERADAYGYDMDNFYKVISFFDMNDNQSEVYYFYRENSNTTESLLYDFFLLKCYDNQHVDIIYKQ